MQARELLEMLLAGTDLDGAEASALMTVFLDPAVSDTVKGALLIALRAKGETADEVRGLALGMRAAALPLPTPVNDDWVDTCGTGGDGHHSFNVSTATALLLAASGESVVKHGNRSVSSACGSADVLEAAGVPLYEDPAEAVKLLERTGFTFLFAPSFHPSMRSVVPTRRALKVRTVFNILGPLSNPAQPKHQLIGAFSEQAAALMAETVSGLPITRCFVVHGEGGWDEATPCGTFELFDVTPGRVRRYTADPREYGIARCTDKDLAGGNPHHNAGLLRDLFSGVKNPIRDAVLLNTALVFQLNGREADPRLAVQRAAEVIDDGRAARFLASVVA
ncbi:MAG: anthranilate phosphoribosyltransferase [Myxococcota bacterium]|jgi:anthranilate phosphoribosyltransferase